MLKRTLISILFSLLASASTMASAQDSTGELDLPEVRTISKGWRVGLIRAQTDQRLQIDQVGAETVTYDNRNTYTGVGISYADLAINQIGFIAGFSFLGGEQIPRGTLLRADISIGSALNNYFSAKMGVNATHMASNEISSRANGMGFGYTAGVGLKMNPVFSAELNYVSMAQQSFIGSGINTSPIQGFEAQLLATF